MPNSPVQKSRARTFFEKALALWIRGCVVALVIGVLVGIVGFTDNTLDRASDQHIQALCHQQEICRKFAEVRQVCATAGNYKNCVDIKMGSDAKDFYPCSNDGNMLVVPSDMPDRVTCFVAGLRR